jgi:hypothetical protein
MYISIYMFREAVAPCQDGRCRMVYQSAAFRGNMRHVNEAEHNPGRNVYAAAQNRRLGR